MTRGVVLSHPTGNAFVQEAALALAEAGLLEEFHTTLAFFGTSYPAYIIALPRKDLKSICAETGFGKPSFAYSRVGRIPKLTRWRWQNFLPFLRGRLFSENFGMVVKK
jgi:hypothetical protein